MYVRFVLALYYSCLFYGEGCFNYLLTPTHMHVHAHAHAHSGQTGSGKTFTMIGEFRLKMHT